MVIKRATDKSDKCAEVYNKDNLDTFPDLILLVHGLFTCNCVLYVYVYVTVKFSLAFSVWNKAIKFWLNI